jgi:hypothetical protein
MKSQCRECGGSQICEHNRIKSSCKECGGSQICEHGKRKYECKECGGSRICEHNRIKSICKECGGRQICEHGKRKSICKECGGSQICEHNRIKSLCKDCCGGSICEHGKRKCECKECGGSRICEHNIRKSQCKKCGGSEICEHGKYKSRCSDCGGSRICKSRKEPYNTLCRTYGNRKLNGFCCHCFVNLFPDDPRTLKVRSKSKEIEVVSYISSKLDGFIHDKPFYADLEGGCCSTKRRIDLRKLINNTMLCIEIDEDQHKSYIKEKELSRYDDLFMDFSGKYIFIRYNPDKFIDKYNHVKNPFFETRMEVLENHIDTHISRILNGENDELIEIYHLFYNEI